MKIVHSAAEVRPGKRKVSLAIGFFDGVHLGHQQLIRQTVADARKTEGVALVVTFDRHPSTVVAPNRTPQLIYSLARRLKVISAQGADALLLLHFDKQLSEQSGEEFIRDLVRNLGRVQSMTVGANFLFGHQREGNVALLKRLGTSLKFAVRGMAAVSLDGKPVSSTRIRGAIAAGDLDEASQMLGRPYSICGIVLRGDRIGHKLGFPTVNLEVSGLALPPTGVYAAHVEADKKTWRAVLNIGFRPTLNQPEPVLRVEAHLLDFQGDLYGRDLEVIPTEKLREEKKFPSLEKLRAQIAEDIAAAQRYFGHS